MKFDETQLMQAREALLGEGSAELIRFMHHVSLSLDTGGFPAQTVRQAVDLGWIDAQSGRPTGTGGCVADSCREYQFWLERAKALPFEGAAPGLSLEYFRGKSVLEIGSGMGANLMSMSGTAARVCGLEPVECYAQLGAILCEREGLPAPEVLPGAAEALPFGDNHAELILCVTAHQYFDIRPALTEIARVLRPGGELIIIGATLESCFSEGLGELLHGRHGTKAFAITIINTLSYMTMGRRIIPERSTSTTSRPIYPSQAAMHRWMDATGLIPTMPTVRIGPETCFRFRLAPEDVGAAGRQFA